MKAGLVIVGLLTLLRAQQYLPIRPEKFAAIINHSAAHKTFFYNSAKNFSIVRGQFVSMVKHPWFELKLAVRIPDDNVCVVPVLDRAFQIVQSHLTRRFATKPFR